MGAILERMFPTGPLMQLDHVECCNEEVHSSSSSDSWHTHASKHIDTARGKYNVATTKAPCQELSSSAVEQAALANRSDYMAGR